MSGTAELTGKLGAARRTVPQESAAPPSPSTAPSTDLITTARALPLPADVPWARRYARALFAFDAAAVLIALVIAYFLRFIVVPEPAALTWTYVGISALFAVVWLLGLTVEKTRDRRIVGIGGTEYGRVWRASWVLFACIGVAAYLLHFDLARGYVAVAFPVGTVLLLLGRYLARQGLQRLRRSGRGLSRMIVIGSGQGLRELIDELKDKPFAGYVVVGACVPGGDPLTRQHIGGVPILGDVLDAPHAVRQTQAASVAVVGSDHISARVVRDLGYELEAYGTDLIVAPALIDVAGPRVVMSPVEGLSFVHVDAPQFSGLRYVVKSVLDWTLALVAVLLLTIPMLVIAVLIKTTSPGPVLFRQERVGRNGKTFKMFKFRSMRADAEQLLAQLQSQNEGSGPLFKLRNDPRVTPVGAVLRKFSLDELPQFVNVLFGHMSLVGPRPPLAIEVAQYDGHAARRMLVKPGVTGLWQVSGRSDLSWEVGVRKDVYYVENWTVFGDILILLRTARTVLFPDGAY